MNPHLRALAAFAATSAAIFAPASLAAPIPAESRLSAATVYPDRAVVTRLATVAVAAGTNEITFSNLPGSLQDESVQVTAKGSVAASLLDIATRTVFVAAQPDARVKALDDQLLALRQDERVQKDQHAALESQRALVARIENASPPSRPPPPAPPPPRVPPSKTTKKSWPSPTPSAPASTPPPKNSTRSAPPSPKKSPPSKRNSTKSAARRQNYARSKP
jgi:hypothetical protein